MRPGAGGRTWQAQPNLSALRFKPRTRGCSRIVEAQKTARQRHKLWRYTCAQISMQEILESGNAAFASCLIDSFSLSCGSVLL